MRTKHHAKRLAQQLTAQGIPAVDLHGNLSQNARDRNLAAFSSGAAKVLVATDVAARGVHVDDVELVIHVDPPTEHKAYLHRSGRTARAGSEGDVVTICLPAQKQDLKALLRKADIRVTPQQVTAGSPAVATLVGEMAPYVKPQPKAAARRARTRSASAPRARAPGLPRRRPVRAVAAAAAVAARRRMSHRRRREAATGRAAPARPGRTRRSRPRARARAAAPRRRPRRAGHPLARAARPLRCGSAASSRRAARAPTAAPRADARTRDDGPAPGMGAGPSISPGPGGRVSLTA
jgi:superfamily II DNA/RNA helicase